MGSRTQLQTLLEELLGSTSVYFQPPESFKLSYPCIIYSRGVLSKTKFADNQPYLHKVSYRVVVIDRDPDSIIPEKVASLPMCTFERNYKTNNLNYDIYNLYY